MRDGIGEWSVQFERLTAILRVFRARQLPTTNIRLMAVKFLRDAVKAEKLKEQIWRVQCPVCVAKFSRWVFSNCALIKAAFVPELTVFISQL